MGREGDWDGKNAERITEGNKGVEVRAVWGASMQRSEGGKGGNRSLCAADMENKEARATGQTGSRGGLEKEDLVTSLQRLHNTTHL